jgi:predicted metal-dependent phosphoesterase TrpH
MTPPNFGGADLHHHSCLSDGVETPEQLVARAQAAGLSVAALSDHDNLEGFLRFQAAAESAGILSFRATELSTDFEGEDVHVLAYFWTVPSGDFESRLEGFREIRLRRGELMVQRLAEAGYPLDQDLVTASPAGGAFGRPHVARALVAAGHAVSFEDAFERFLGKGKIGYVPKAKWPMADAIRAVRSAGGVTSLAHPVWYKDPMTVLEAAQAAGLDAVEAFHPDQEPEDEGRFRAAAWEASLLVTAGSDFHDAAEGHVIGSRRLGEEDWLRLENLLGSRAKESSS